MLTLKVRDFALELGWRHLFLRVPGIGEAWAWSGDRGFTSWSELRQLKARQLAEREALMAELHGAS
jgi:hypothetical protein